jgi:pullulanase/glycogen debranching enzyme
VGRSGCGNTLDTHRPHALRLVMDSLRYWAQEMHVDGFRFDLAASLGRQTSDFEPFGGFLDAVGQDPVLSEVKLIAEPWDAGQGGCALGNSGNLVTVHDGFTLSDLVTRAADPPTHALLRPWRRPVASPRRDADGGRRLE